VKVCYSVGESTQICVSVLLKFVPWNPLLLLHQCRHWLHIVACSPVAMQRSRNGRIYQTPLWAMAL
jgi:hypothetical protein